MYEHTFTYLHRFWFSNGIDLGGGAILPPPPAHCDNFSTTLNGFALGGGERGVGVIFFAENVRN